MRRCSLLQNIILSYNLYEKLLLCSLAKLSFKVTNIIGVFHGAIQTGSKIVQYQIGHRGRGRTPSWFDNDLGSFRFFFSGLENQIYKVFGGNDFTILPLSCNTVDTSSVCGWHQYLTTCE